MTAWGHVSNARLVRGDLMEEFNHLNFVKQLKELQRIIDAFVEEKCDGYVVFKKFTQIWKFIQNGITNAFTMGAKAAVEKAKCGDEATPRSGGCSTTTTKTKEVEKSIYS